jgi:hypothetical protein
MMAAEAMSKELEVLRNASATVQARALEIAKRTAANQFSLTDGQTMAITDALLGIRSAALSLEHALDISERRDRSRRI